MMASVRSRDTTPELRVRRFLHAAGLRFRLHVRGVRGTPDLYFPRYRTALFVHGCFWHQHPGCPKAALPKANHAFWAAKLAGNAERDRRTAGALAASGVRVLTVWECETRDPDALRAVAAAVREVR